MNGRLVEFERRGGGGGAPPSWGEIQALVERLAAEYSPAAVALDGSRDNKIIADLEHESVSVEPISFSASKKKTVIENLVVAIEKSELTLSSDANALLNELEQYEQTVTDAGNVSYGAPTGLHDDGVDALALALEAKEGGGRGSQQGWMVTMHPGSTRRR